jgi:phage terminase large subunit-like protein
MPAQASLVKRLNFCIWTEGADLWLDAGLWQANGGELRPLLGRSCFGGLDLSTVRDLSAECRVFPDTDGSYDVTLRCWMPRDSYLKRVEEDHAPYDQWVREGWIELTDGNVIDYDVIRDRILEDAKANPVPGAGVRPLECDPALHPVDV